MAPRSRGAVDPAALIPPMYAPTTCGAAAPVTTGVVSLMLDANAALGVAETARVEQIITGLKERGIPLIIISHNLRQVFDLADRIYVFRQGRIICNRLTSQTNPQEIVGLITGAIDPATLAPEVVTPKVKEIETV